MTEEEEKLVDSLSALNDKQLLISINVLLARILDVLTKDSPDETDTK